MSGELGILNVGAGDTKLSFDPSKPEERERAARIVTDMLKRGFALLIEAGKDDQGRPLFRRADGFDEATCEYIIVDLAPADEVRAETQRDETPAPRRGRRRVERRVAASETTGVAVARVAGG